MEYGPYYTGHYYWANAGAGPYKELPYKDPFYQKIPHVPYKDHFFKHKSGPYTDPPVVSIYKF